MPLKIEVHRVGIRHLFGASKRLGGDELGVQRACPRRATISDPRHVEEIGQRLIEPARLKGDYPPPTLSP